MKMLRYTAMRDKTDTLYSQYQNQWNDKGNCGLSVWNAWNLYENIACRNVRCKRQSWHRISFRRLFSFEIQRPAICLLTNPQADNAWTAGAATFGCRCLSLNQFHIIFPPLYFSRGMLPVSLLTFFLLPQIASPMYFNSASEHAAIFLINSL